MNRLTTENPTTNFETMMNMVYAKDGWQYIRHGAEGMSTIDFCSMLCHQRECPLRPEETATNEAKDELFYDCLFERCPIATVYAALCGYGHVRDRLMKYEDAGVDLQQLKVETDA